MPSIGNQRTLAQLNPHQYRNQSHMAQPSLPAGPPRRPSVAALDERGQEGLRGSGQLTVGADRRGQVPAQVRAVDRDRPKALPALALDGRRRHEGCPESQLLTAAAGCHRASAEEAIIALLDRLEPPSDDDVCVLAVRVS